MLHKKNISGNQNRNTEKKQKNRKKTTKIGLAYVQFYKTKIHRGKKRH